MKPVEKIQEVLEDPFRFIKNWKSQNGQRIIGIFLPDVPEELIDASGMLPFAVLGGKKSPSPTGIIPNFACSLITNTLDQAYFGDLEFLDGMVIPHLCDSSRALFHIWDRRFPKQFSDQIRLPKKSSSQGAKAYLAEELKRFKEILEKTFGVNISNEELWKSISTYNENRYYLRTIQALRSQIIGFMNNYEFFSLVKSSMVMPKNEHNKILKEVVAHVESSPANFGNRPPIKVFVSGKLVEPLEIFQWMDEAGILVAGDDLAVGSRYFSYKIEGEGDALNALAQSYFERIPNALVEGPEDRLSFILKKVQENGINGVIFVHLKFCEPLAFDYPDIKKGLDQKGIPNLFIETELRGCNVGQIKTRLQAFVEILGSKE
jgi:bcr-type benzoyl-CoA reductase subunit C